MKSFHTTAANKQAECKDMNRIKGGALYLATAAAFTNKWDIVQSVLPKLIDLKKGEQLSKKEKLQLAFVLLSYSEKCKNKELFVQNVNEMNVHDVLLDDDLNELVIKGCNLFEGEDIDKICKRFYIAPNRALTPTVP